ncbi:MAG: hypothetical protein MAG795_01182 [Candidatus Woesearchaeota archaeon]|nr:hypothetical protein [Candidatus Woesearchaeota archaeon]
MERIFIIIFAIFIIGIFIGALSYSTIKKPNITGAAAGGFWGPTYCWSDKDCIDKEICCYFNEKATCKNKCEEGQILDSNWLDQNKKTSNVTNQKNLTTISYEGKKLKIDDSSRTFEVDVIE